MSNHLFRIWAAVFHALTHRAPSLTAKELTTNLWGIGIGTGVHALYAYSTGREEDIQVVKKYKMNRYGFTDFMIIDSKGRHFNVNNSLWYWKWNSVEEWSRLQEGETRAVHVYGIRKPVLGLFPNII